MSLISLFFLSPKLSSSTGQHKGYDIGDEPPCCSLCLPTQFVGMLNICQSIRFSTAKSKLSGRNIKRLLREATKNFHRGEGMRFSWHSDGKCLPPHFLRLWFNSPKNAHTLELTPCSILCILTLNSYDNSTQLYSIQLNLFNSTLLNSTQWLSHWSNLTLLILKLLQPNLTST